MQQLRQLAQAVALDAPVLSTDGAYFVLLLHRLHQHAPCALTTSHISGSVLAELVTFLCLAWPGSVVAHVASSMAPSVLGQDVSWVFAVVVFSLFHVFYVRLETVAHITGKIESRSTTLSKSQPNPTTTSPVRSSRTPSTGRTWCTKLSVSQGPLRFLLQGLAMIKSQRMLRLTIRLATREDVYGDVSCVRSVVLGVIASSAAASVLQVVAFVKRIDQGKHVTGDLVTFDWRWTLCCAVESLCMHMVLVLGDSKEVMGDVAVIMWLVRMYIKA